MEITITTVFGGKYYYENENLIALLEQINNGRYDYQIKDIINISIEP